MADKEKVYDEKKFTETLFKISRSFSDGKPTAAESKKLLEDARSEAQQYMATKLEVLIVDMILDGYKRGYEVMGISQLAHMAWFYYSNRETAAQGAFAQAHPDKRGKTN